MIQQAIFAGGPPRYLEATFQHQTGILLTEVGYCLESALTTIHDVTNSLACVRLTYDDSIIEYVDLLALFWRSIDPTDSQGQFLDRGIQYRTAILATNESQRKQAMESKETLEKSHRFSKPIVTEIREMTPFYVSDDTEQRYELKNPVAYRKAMKDSGRKLFETTHWAKTVQDSSHLTPLQKKVALEAGTEPPFRNAYWDNHQPGLYVDILSNTVLFSSLDQFDSGCGWPSFAKPVNASRVLEQTDTSYGMVRSEIRSRDSYAHLGHLFDDGPRELGGQRYCINSASLRFIPLDRLDQEGFGAYKRLFDKKTTKF